MGQAEATINNKRGKGTKAVISTRIVLLLFGSGKVRLQLKDDTTV